MSAAARRWLLWAVLSLATLAAVVWASRALTQAARERWLIEMQAASQRPQQFVLNWLELRRQLLRALALQSRGQGWTDSQAFLIDLAAVSQDSDGEIALAAAVARVDAQGQLQPLAGPGLQMQDWHELERRGVPAQPREQLGAPMPDGRIPLARPVAGDQWVWLLLDVPELIQQLQSLDWPAGLHLRLLLVDLEGRLHPVTETGPPPALAQQFRREEASVPGGWRFDWSVDLRHSPVTPWQANLLTLAALAVVLGLSGLAALLLRQTQRLQILNQALQRRHADLEAALQERRAALLQLAEQQRQQLERSYALLALPADAQAETPQGFALGALLQELLQELGPQARALECLLSYEPGAELKLQGPRQALQGALRLLLQQALSERLAHRLGAELHVGFRLQGGETVMLWIEDNAPPLDQQARQRLFEPWLAADAPDGHAQAHLAVRLLSGLWAAQLRYGNRPNGNRLELLLPLQPGPG